MTKFEINGHPVDDNSPPLFFPDIGTFFNQDMTLAKKMIMQLHSSGSPLVKGEILHDPSIALDDDTEELYLGLDGHQKSERNRSLIERKVVSLDAYETLFTFCKSLGMGFLLSVYDFKGAEFARDIGASALKIASSNIVHRPLIECAARLGLPLIIDTGKSTLEEIARAVQWAREAKAVGIMIQHSPEAPPSSLTNHNLRMIAGLRQIFGCPVGLSDHHVGDEMLYAAVALGAHSVEKGIVPDEMGDDQDVFHALPISKFALTLQKMHRIKIALGSSMRENLSRDSKKHPYRMGLIAKKDIACGDVFTLDNVGFAFPAKGIPVEHWELVKGWRAASQIGSSQIISWQDVNPLPT